MWAFRQNFNVFKQHPKSASAKPAIFEDLFQNINSFPKFHSLYRSKLKLISSKFRNPSRPFLKLLKLSSVISEHLKKSMPVFEITYAANRSLVLFSRVNPFRQPLISSNAWSEKEHLLLLKCFLHHKWLLIKLKTEIFQVFEPFDTSNDISNCSAINPEQNRIRLILNSQILTY